MESNADYDSNKTPKRARKSSVKELDVGTDINRSTRKRVILQEIDEKEVASVNDCPVAPNYLTKVIDVETPSRSDAIAGVQTPRRSVRKSIKPVQEYENIIAQKGLSAKRVICSSTESTEEATAEGKWVPAVIGRVSTKRVKKARRLKKKQLLRQEGIETGSTDVDENVTQNPLGGDKDGIKIHHQEIEENLDVDQNYVNDNKANDSGDDGEPQSCEVLLDTEDKAVEGKFVSEKVKENNGLSDVQIVCVQPLDDGSTCKDGEEQVKIEEIKEDPPKYKNNNETDVDLSDASMEAGDTEMTTMPVTADDCNDILGYPQASPNKSPITHSGAESANKNEDSDCIMISFSDSSNTEVNDVPEKCIVKNEAAIGDICDSTENNMPTLLLISDDEDEVEDVFVTKTRPQVGDQMISPLEVKEDKGDFLNCTFDAVESPTKKTETIESETPKCRPSVPRVQTPFKANKAIIPDVIGESQEDFDSDEILNVLIEPREITMKSNRKRSISFCVDRPQKSVTFHSPSNTTIAIYNYEQTSIIQEDANSVTKRRKRSLSVTETKNEVAAYLKQRKPSESTPSKKAKIPEPTSRSKMPNFTAIHQQRFQKMESISDHVARRAERARVLTNSITKVKPSSIQKGLPVKNSVIRECYKTSAGDNKAIPKARQRMELSAIEHKPTLRPNSGIKPDSIAKADLSLFGEYSTKLASKMGANTFTFNSNTRPQLPKPRFDATFKTDIRGTSNIPKTATTLENKNAASVSQFHSSLPGSRPRFNTSTAIDRHPAKLGDKPDDRRNRYLEMFKSRNTSRGGEKKNEILKGVRTNRRFELQMMCRNLPN